MIHSLPRLGMTFNLLLCLCSKANHVPTVRVPSSCFRANKLGIDIRAFMLIASLVNEGV